MPLRMGGSSIHPAYRVPNHMLKFIVLTDTHFVPPGQPLYGLDPAERLRPAIEVINREYADCEFVVICGDLAHKGEQAAYESLAEVLAPLLPPVVLLVGNHDQRDACRAVFPDLDRDDHGFVQSMRLFEEATVITADTLDERDRARGRQLERLGRAPVS